MKLVTALIDMDGPLADFDAYFYDRINDANFQIECTRDTQVHRFATEHMPDDRERDLARKMIYETGWFEGLPVTAGAQEGLEQIAIHADTWICTKPLEENPTCRDGKAQWVKEHLGEYWVRRLIITPDKSMVRGAVLLDDAPNPEWFGQALWSPVIFPCPWNGEGSKWEGLPRWTWGDPLEELLGEAASRFLAVR